MDYKTIENQQQQFINQGKQDYQSYLNNQAQYKGQYDTDTAAAQAAQGKVSDYANYLQGAGSGTNVYNQAMQTSMGQAGYDPSQMQQAINTQAGLQGQAAAANQAFNTQGGVNMAGLTAPAAAAYANSIMSPLQQGISAYNSKIGNLNTQYQNVLTGAQQSTGAQLNTEKMTQDQLQYAYADANTQAANAMQQMNFYGTLAQTQQGLNASQAQNFYTARQAFQAAQNAAAQAGLAIAGTTAQNQRNTMLGNVLNSSTYKDAIAHPEKYKVTYGSDGTPQYTLKNTSNPKTPTPSKPAPPKQSTGLTQPKTGWLSASAPKPSLTKQFLGNWYHGK